MTEEKIESGMGFNEKYYEGFEAKAVLQTGDPHPDLEEFWAWNDEPVDWDVQFETSRFRKQTREDVTAYVSLDQYGDVQWVVTQYP